MLEVAVTQIDAAIRRSELVITYELAEMRLSANTGYVEGSVTFANGARLIFFEFFRQTASETARENAATISWMPTTDSSFVTTMRLTIQRWPAFPTTSILG